jgi:hypothetical protein
MGLLDVRSRLDGMHEQTTRGFENEICMKAGLKPSQYLYFAYVCLYPLNI